MMRVLWLAGNAAPYEAKNNQGCGWIGALQSEILKMDDICLSIAFPCPADFKEERGPVTYYGIKKIRYPIFLFKHKQEKQLQRIKDVVEDFRPDIIHVFGSESGMGLVCKITSVPVVMHIQGVLSAYFETFMPYNMSWKDYLIMNPLKYISYDAWKKFIIRENEIFKSCIYFMGRTAWDRGITTLLAPNARYFHCDEMMRPEIMHAKAWSYQQRLPIVITSTISNPIYKGTDVILRTASLLRHETQLDFVWNVYGVDNLGFAERLTGIKAADVGVIPAGRVSVSDLVRHLQSSSLYIHPSYIENSANSICEAQCIGLPVIATDVGGTVTLVEHEQSGLVVPANDIYSLAAQIMRLSSSPELAIELGAEARRRAQERHNPQKIANRLMLVYQEIVNRVVKMA